LLVKLDNSQFTSKQH